METIKCKHQYPRTIENKVRVCVLCGYAEETNELPEEVLEELNQGEKYEDVPLIRWVKSHIRRAFRASKNSWAASDWISRNEIIIECQIKEHDARLLQLKEEEYKSEIERLTNGEERLTTFLRSIGIEAEADDDVFEKVINEMNGLSEQLKAKDEELAKLTSALRDWGHKAEGWNKLESENERLRGLLEKCRPLAFHSTLDPKQNWNNQATELLQEIDLLSQSTDKPNE